MTEHKYWPQVRDLVESGNEQRLPKHDIRERIVHLVHAAHSAGEPWAADVLARWETAGADADYTKVFKDLNTVTYIRADGRRVRKTVAYSRPMRSQASGEIVGRQMQAWWGMSRSAILDLRREVAELSIRLSDVIAALDALIDAMTRHPEFATAREAWEADGRSVDEIDLSQVAS
jgi:hypothetical protein